MLTTHSHNLYYHTSQDKNLLSHGTTRYTAASVGQFEPTCLTVAPAFAQSSGLYSPQNFRPLPASVLVDRGFTCAGFTTDLFGQLRGQVWDIGAIELPGTAPAQLQGFHAVP